VAPARAPESNIEIIFADWLDAMRRGDLETMAGRLAPDVVHQGVRPELICRNREQVIDMVGRRAGRVPPVEAIELIAAGDHVVMSVRGAGIGPPVDATRMSLADRRPLCTRWLTADRADARLPPPRGGLEAAARRRSAGTSSLQPSARPALPTGCDGV
jgi:hypothetical protein